MGVLVGFPIFLLVCSVSYSYVLLGEDEPTVDITWPSEYFFKGQTVDVYNGIVHPYRIWYSAEYNRSRMELYDGEVNNYYVTSSENERGGIYKILTITTANLTNEIQCMYEDFEAEAKDFLPDTSYMNNTGSYDFNGKVVHEWKRTIEEEREYKLEDTLLVYRTEYGIDIPVIYDQKKYDLDGGALLDHTIMEFYDFKPSVQLEDLEIEDEDECEQIGTDFAKNLKFLHPVVSDDLDTAFSGYQNHHNKQYKTKEIALRKTIFHKNWRLVVNHNRKKLGYKLAMNKYADRTDEELQFLTGTRPSPHDSKGTHTFHSLEEVDRLVDELPEEFDLRLKGVMTPIKQQGHCGSCWAFSSTAAVEGALSYELGGRNVELSEQSLVDCAWGYDNYGCMGGSLNDVFKYILDHGIASDVDYGQYKEENGKCHIQNLTSLFRIRGFGKVNRNSINSIKLALNKYGPVTVSVLATYNMKLYSSGVFYDDECEYGYANHGVVIVGYGIRDGDLYWIVRNSWGEEWGEDGHILMSATQNNCYLLDDPYYVLV